MQDASLSAFLKRNCKYLLYWRYFYL